MYLSADAAAWRVARSPSPPPAMSATSSGMAPASAILSLF